MRKSFFVPCVIFLLIHVSLVVKSQHKISPDSIRSKMQWFQDAKLGIFIHWGIYAVNGIDESWSFYNRKISWPDYMRQLLGFTAAKYDPAFWASVIKSSGARYAVITTKHHDGVALWDTKEKHYDVVDNTPAKKDLLAPFYKALRTEGIKTGAYFSLLDWSHPDYPAFIKDSNRYKISDQPQRWEKFRTFYRDQLTEINTLYKPDLWWFDGDWEHSAEEWKSIDIRRELLQENPNAIINGRLQGYGDYETPEQNIPVSRPKYNWWELCMTINNNWGYQPADTNWKTPYEIITIFADVISNGGNMLLDIGPRANGSIPEQQLQVLKELGAWNRVNEKAVFGTLPGIPQGHFFGPTTLSKDSTKLYLFVEGNMSGQLLLKGLDNKINEITVLGSGKKLHHKVVGKISWSPVPGLVYIDLPKGISEKYITVLELSLDKPVNLYSGHGGFN
jgi:alpha-L-fucosidase